ncbi:efflux transporter outer membrane subunit [Hylemonella gracilis]|uniref:RND efflux system, outer membrane lipoprotein, NodT family n=1 Tax=Hylemonella gracilis ATCC 19624 TaxID=887062 RepID=F3KUS5_9BURK|nr:efflux transporter outer membrane subunit [Hylemonella gracilis]EGI76474.1 RND efflux system, outer membrane lipoprotein, NodT family [Hylemonella gracilis ATCC 19624]
MLRSLSLVATAALLSACTVLTPSYERPALSVPDVWPAEIQVDARTVAAKPVAWESFFPDERLRALIQLALEHNRDMRIATARVLEAQALYGVQRADRLPSLNAGGSVARSRTPGDLSGTGSSVLGRRADVNVAIPSFELDFWGRVASLSDAAKASYLATEQAERSFRLSLIANVADAYLAQSEADERLQLAQATLKTRAQTRELVDQRRKGGLAGDLDYLQADAAYEGARAEVASLTRQQSAARNYLATLVGTQPANLPPARSLAAQGIALDQQAELPSQVLLRRPDVRAAEQRLLAANANIGAARAAFFPRIGFTGSTGFASSEIDGLFKSGSQAWSFTPTISLPIFQGGRNKANLDLATVRKDIAVAEYEKTIQQAFREVADQLVARDQLAAQLQAVEAQERSQQRATLIAEARYAQGVGSFLEVLDAQRQLFSVQQSLIQVRRSMWSAAAQLYKALGGSDDVAAGQKG